jgi:carboxypeptidase C (cathepsin A)
VTSLPGLAQKPCFQQWSGYAKTTTAEKFLFSWVVEAESEPENKPVVLWLNGGPGCSSLGGMWTELGPFVVNKDQTVGLNPYSWNKAATMIFVEQPAGVGFSYPATDTNDTITAEDTYHALLDIFAQLPALRKRPFYIFGESYGGHYVPNTVKAVLDGNAAMEPTDPKVIDMKGFGVGNGYVDWALDFNMNVPFGRYHALCSPTQYNDAIEACNGTTVACFWPKPGAECTAKCGAAVTAATANAVGGAIDIYDIYADKCIEGQERIPDQAFMLELERQKALRAHSASKLTATPISPIYATCAESYVNDYLSRADVQDAIHAKRLKKWSMCGLTNSGTANASAKKYDFNFESTLPYFAQWLEDKKTRYACLQWRC